MAMQTRSLVLLLATPIVAVLTEDERIDVSSQESPDEIKGFSELSDRQHSLQKLGEFLQDMPQLEHTAEFDCSNCQTHNKVELKGLADFF